MIKIAGMLAILGLNVCCANEIPSDVMLDKVSFQVSGKQWVNTKTALLVVNINATLTNADLVKARSDIMDSLNKIANGEWHLIQFERSQDSSGLEKLFAQSQARIDQASLTNVYQHAKAISKPGASYEIGSIEFKPSLEEEQQSQAQLRAQLYQQAQDELARINKIYPGQNYTLNSLSFASGDPVQKSRDYKAGNMLNAMVMPAGAPAPTLTLSNEIIMTALVQAASNRPKVN